MASAAGSKPSPGTRAGARAGIGRVWAVALVLILVLLTLGGVLELGTTTRIVVDGPLTLPAVPASRAALADAALVDEAVQLTPAFTIDAPTTLEISLHRGSEEGWVGVDLALIEEETGEIRQLGLATNVRAAVGADIEAARTSTVLIDRVVPGRYVVRIVSSWEPLEEPEPGRAPALATPSPPAAQLRIVEGHRSYRGLALALLLILLPPVFMTGRAVFARSRG